MAWEARPGDFTLFPNDKKGNDHAPDYSGPGLDPEGSPIKVSCWIKEGTRGRFFSCRMEYKGMENREQQAPNRAAEPQKKQGSPAADINDDDIPF